MSFGVIGWLSEDNSPLSKCSCTGVPCLHHVIRLCTEVRYITLAGHHHHQHKARPSVRDLSYVVTEGAAGPRLRVSHSVKELCGIAVLVNFKLRAQTLSLRLDNLKLEAASG